MYIASIKIDNYKCFWQTEEIPLTAGFNVIVGPNNAGKSTLAELLTLKLQQHDPHKSLITKPHKTAQVAKNESSIDIALKLNKEDFDLWYNERRELLVRFLSPDNNYALSTFPNLYQKNDLPYLMARIGIAKSVSTGFQFEKEPIDGHSLAAQYIYEHGRLRANRGQFRTRDSFDRILFENIRSSAIYMFNAERFNISEAEIGSGRILSRNASNLPSVLHQLMTSNPRQYKRYLDSIKIVFPEVKDITLPPVSNNMTRILLWTIDPETERDDLAIPLSESGTGIGQVLAMLYVIITSDFPKIIIIDEPQSFLHPGAIRKLFEILKQHDQHQYIITTHSPIVISAASPDNILLINKKDSVSHVEVIDKSKKRDMERVLRSVGASLSDVFGADNILWVEGPTEERCFPEILRHIKYEIQGTVIKSVIATGDFLQNKKQKAQTILSIYERLSKGIALMPPAVGFMFDTENLTQNEITDLKRMSKNENGQELLDFIPRMMYENYLLHPQAIAEIMSKDLDRTVLPDNIQAWFDKNLWLEINGKKEWNKKYFGRSKPSGIEFDDALEKIHGAKVLNDLFLELSETQLDYDSYKADYGYELTMWLLKNDPEQLKFLADFIANCLTQWKKTNNEE